MTHARELRQKLGLALRALLMFLIPSFATAGPPYVTDDPEPVDFRHFEIYLASIANRDDQGWSGTAPHVEVNYGVFPDLQLHLILPAAYSAPTGAPSHHGFGDIELGAKFRFVHEQKWLPQIGTFPQLEIPSGNAANALGAGHAQVLLPLWLQKSCAAWTTYGGLGYLFNSAANSHGSWFFGWQVQRTLSDKFTIGTEVFHTTPKDVGGEDETRFNLGLVVDVTHIHHVLLSFGRGFQGPNRFQAYLAYQITFALPNGPSK